MAYRKIKSFTLTEQELREIWNTEYCNKEIKTFDGVVVQF